MSYTYDNCVTNSEGKCENDNTCHICKNEYHEGGSSLPDNSCIRTNDKTLIQDWLFPGSQLKNICIGNNSLDLNCSRGGIYDPNLKKCICTPGSIGNECKNVTRRCNDIVQCIEDKNSILSDCGSNNDCNMGFENNTTTSNNNDNQNSTYNILLTFLVILVLVLPPILSFTSRKKNKGGIYRENEVL